MSLVTKPAPNIEGQAYANGEIRNFSLKDLRGKWVVAVFYPLDFTFVCPTELRAFGQSREEFQKRNAEIVAISCDSVHSHKAWIERDLKEVKYPVVADLTKKIASDYGVLMEEKGFPLRGTFIIDPNGVVQHESVNATGVGRSTDETLRLLEAFQQGELCPVNWKKGEKTLGK